MRSISNLGTTLILVVGFLALVVIWGLFAAVGAIFGLFLNQPFLLGLGVGVGGSALVGRQLLLRVYRLEKQNRELTEALDRVVYGELAT